MFGIELTEVRRKDNVRGDNSWAEIFPPTTWKGLNMLYTIAVVLIILWLLGLVSSYTLGGFIHILLVLAVVVILVNIINGRRAL